MTTGNGYALAGVGQWYDIPIPSEKWTEMVVYPGGDAAGYITTATFDPTSGALTGYTVDCPSCPALQQYTASSPESMQSDAGVLGWGRWLSGTANEEGEISGLHNIHYVVGQPTPPADLQALQTGNVTGTYALIGATPISVYNTGTGNSIANAGSLVSASLTANFGSGTVMGNLGASVGAITYSTNWSGYISGHTFTGTGNVQSTITDCLSMSCYGYVGGLFAGPNASHAGLVFKFFGADAGDITGAAAFRR